MSRLRLVPPAWFLLAVALQVTLDRAWPIAEILARPWHWLGFLCLVPALSLAAPGARALRRGGTTLNPYGEPTALVTDGPYRYTRNPLYLALACVLLGTAVYLGSLTPFLVVPLFGWVITVLFIRREEAALGAAFGQRYADYCRQVRRWL